MIPDRAEQQIFAALPQLDAVPRRGLALALAGVPRAGIASELGLSGAALSEQLARGRKALRRTRVELASGGRCERAERALSDRLDGVLSDLDGRFLGAHLARCSRCRIHEAELTAALEELEAAFAAPPAEQPAPTRARLRVVPPAPQLPAAPEPAALGAHAAEGGGSAAPPEPDRPTVVEEPEPVVAEIQPPTPASHKRIRAALPIAVAVLIAIGLIAAAIALFGYGNDTARAPWNTPNAPIVHPAPISGQ
ncbi:MAG: zf-HC2 domain-containing protein [Actinobacteria bacterium]|nr:MAG: zf-HC2 domain-containing protein [Actinomycetota bacterium]